MASCVGCKFLYLEDEGYSAYTVLDTIVHCAKNRNDNLTDGNASEPFDWNTENDNWPKTRDSRCELYAAGPMVRLDLDGSTPEDDAADPEASAAIRAHTGRSL